MDTEKTAVGEPQRFKTLLTRKGLEKSMQAARSEKKVNIVTAAVGDGGGAWYLPTEDMEALKGERWRGSIASAEINAKSANMTDVEIVIPGDVGGFTIRECGLFDEDGDMIAICNMPDMEKAVIEDGAASTLTVLMHLLLANGHGLKFVVDPNVKTITAADMMKHDKDQNAHAELIGDIKKTLDKLLGGGSGGEPEPTGSEIQVVQARIREPERPDYGIESGGADPVIVSKFATDEEIAELIETVFPD